ncbi:hypothetical protein DFH07DRAFT_854724 [Mycena maculata]|uniref:F-box domain-containing protein n=1 Tax=Mycena maculata TaxID=230809 RepID=A0AAD7HPH3_9AGAR|nr:hypothetical protein DFH07DRAFT_854724 [Mycena maculata]
MIQSTSLSAPFALPEQARFAMSGQFASELWAVRQNILPDPVERISIQKSIYDAETSLSSLSAEQEDAACEIRARISLLGSRLAPIRRLPPEILSSIFVDPSLHTSISRGTFLLAGRGSDPVTAVSFHWRATALSTPHFWAIFSVSLCGTDNVMHLLQLYLNRSKNCALSLEIRVRGSDVHPGILREILNGCERWATLRLDIVTPDLLSLFSPIRRRLRSLRQLSLQIGGGFGAGVSIEGLDTFELAPNLSTLKLSLPDGVLPRVPFAQIKTLSISADFLPFAARFPNLSFLSVTGNPGEPSSPIVTADVPSLSAHPAVLQGVTTPTLVHLHLSGGGTPWSSRQFEVFVQRSQFALRTLTLDNVRIRGKDVVHVLPLVPMVQSLTLQSLQPHAITEIVMRALTRGDGPQSLPALTTLSLSGSYLFSTPTLLEMLESRISVDSHSAPLRWVKLHLRHREFGAEQLDRLRALTRSGVSLSVKCLNADKQFVTML